MRRAVVSFLTGQGRNTPEFLKHATDRWVYSLRKWFPFDGDIILYVNDGVKLPKRLTANVELRSLEPIYAASDNVDVIEGGKRFSNHSGNLFALKPFVLRAAVTAGGYDTLLMADVDALAVKSIDQVFDRCECTGKIFVSTENPHGSQRVHHSKFHRGCFTDKERHQADQRGMRPANAGFIMGPVAALGSVIDVWTDNMFNRKYRGDGQPGLEEQSALNLALFQNPGMWTAPGGWVSPFDFYSPSWQWPGMDVYIWHFFGRPKLLANQHKVFQTRNKGETTW